MYKGFPVGYLLFWETGAEAGARQIGIEAKQKAPRLLIVDGQQRLTSLYAVITGSKIIKDDYSEGRIRIAFRPTDAMFAVADAASDKDPEFIADVSALWVPGQRKNVVRAYLHRLAGKRSWTTPRRTASMRLSTGCMTCATTPSRPSSWPRRWKKSRSQRYSSGSTPRASP